VASPATLARPVSGMRRLAVRAAVVWVAVIGLFGVIDLLARAPSSPLRRIEAAAGLAGSARSEGAALDSALFAPGSCVAYPPTDGDRHLTVFLDAGHGGLDPGATGVTDSGQPLNEANETLPVELDAMALLRAHGYRVVVSRTRASTVARLEPGDASKGVFTVEGEHHDVAARDLCANLARANVLIGIYFDAAASRQSAGSITAYDAVRPFARASHRLARLLQRDVLAELNARGFGIPDDGVQTDTLLGGTPLTSAADAYDHLLLLGPAKSGYFSTPSEMPGALIEPLFITDPFEATLVVRPAVQRLIAEGIAASAEQYFTSTPERLRS
jgi:N-acetylmuramoyl-L-alanine amidase